LSIARRVTVYRKGAGRVFEVEIELPSIVVGRCTLYDNVEPSGKVLAVCGTGYGTVVHLTDEDGQDGVPFRRGLTGVVSSSRLAYTVIWEQSRQGLTCTLWCAKLYTCLKPYESIQEHMRRWCRSPKFDTRR
jgi:hypothetical protein